MFERRDARVRAGPVMASSAGDRASFIRAARDWGVLLFGYFLLDKQEKVTRCPAGARKLLISLLTLMLMLSVDVDRWAANPSPRNGESRSALQQPQHPTDNHHQRNEISVKLAPAMAKIPHE
jgi:hypothetical protein